MCQLNRVFLGEVCGDSVVMAAIVVAMALITLFTLGSLTDKARIVRVAQIARSRLAGLKITGVMIFRGSLSTANILIIELWRLTFVTIG